MTAKQKVDLVSPYLEPWIHLMQQIDSADKRGVKINLYFRDDKAESYRDLCKEFARFGVEVFAVQFLHSKIYANESTCILTSMNLLDFSASNSEEFGIYLDDSAIVKEVHKYIGTLKTRARPIRESILSNLVKTGVKAIVNRISDALEPTGNCIRCRTQIDLDPNKPYCVECFSSWNKYQDRFYEEQYCHSCGKPTRTSMAKPLCRSCYPKFV